MDNVDDIWKNLNKIHNAQELLDIAFSKSMKIKPPKSRGDAIRRSKEHEINRINTFSSSIYDRLSDVVENFPSLNQIHPFYYELMDIVADLDVIRLSLGRVDGVKESIRNLTYDIQEELQNNQSKMKIKGLRKSLFGRISSMIYQVADAFIELENARHQFSKLPNYNPALPCVVVCGVPNVGKSSFINFATSGKPEIASYPFTTKKLIFGHRNMKFFQIQFVDTPGLLDRPIEDRNIVELQALAALKHLADVMIYMIDISELASSTLNEQLNLLQDIYNYYSASKFIVVISKIDLISNSDISAIEEKLEELNLVNNDKPLFHFSSKDHKRNDSILSYLEDIILNDLIKGPKFKGSLFFEIDPDLLPEEEIEGFNY